MSLMAEFRQYIADKRVRTVRISGLGTRVVSTSTWTAVPATMTFAAPTHTDDTYSCMVGPAAAAVEYKIVASATLDNGEIVTLTFTTEVYS